MSFFDSMSITASGLTMQRLRMDVISQNITNINTTRTAEGGPYRRKIVLVEEEKNNFADVLSSKLSKFSGNGVKVSEIVEDERPFKKVYDPAHPDADEEGYVNMPNVNIVEEMVNMISATRAYEANITCMNGSKNMALKALEIGK